MSVAERPLERKGVQALYTFTPFKIVYKVRHEDYEEYYITLIEARWFVGLILPRIALTDPLQYIASMQDNIEQNYSRRILNYWKGLRYVGDISVLTRRGREAKYRIYIQYPVFKISRDSRSFVVFLRETLLRYIKECGDVYNRELFGKIVGRKKPLYIEFSYESLTRPKLCERGYVILSSQETCPLNNVCPLRNSERLRQLPSCPFYRDIHREYRETYEGTYKVSAVIGKWIEVKDKSPLHLCKLVVSDNKVLVDVYYVDNVDLYAWYESILLIPKRADIRAITLYIPQAKKIGRSCVRAPAILIRKTKGILFEINLNELKSLLNSCIGCISNNWLYLKFGLYDKYNEEELRKWGILAPWIWFSKYYLLRRFKECVLRNRRISARIVRYFEKEKIENNYEQYTTFVTLVFAHTLAHLLVQELSAFLGLPRESLLYYIEHPLACGTADRCKIIIVEAQSGGYGYISQLIKASPSTFIEFLNNTIDKLRKLCTSEYFGKLCVESCNEILQRIEYCRRQLVEKYAKQYNLNERQKIFLSKIADCLFQIYSALCLQRVYPHITTVYDMLRLFLREERRNITGVYRININVLRDFVSDLIDLLPKTFDCGAQCLEFERGCLFSDYEQPLLLSAALLCDFVNIFNIKIVS